MFRVSFAVAMLAACTSTTRNPAFCGDGAGCIDDSLPFCDIDGTVDHHPDTCIAPSCEPGSFVACRKAETLVCNSTGDNIDVLECASGCVQGAATCTPCTPGEFSCGAKVVQKCGTDGVFHPAETCDVACVNTPAPHCAFLEPKYLPADICDVPAADAFVFPGSTSFDTSRDANCTGGIIMQPPGPEICVVRATSISIPTGKLMNVVGTRALALVADSSIDIAGTIDVGAFGSVNGPGGDIGNAGKGQITGASSGGGGFATVGGNGVGAINGGPASTNPALLTTLIGGSRGGEVQTDGGGAGGVATIVSCRGTVSVTGTITAGGGGGGGGKLVILPMISFNAGGFGGGSGGNVVIQGMQINLTGMLSANGGGGGAGRPSTGGVGASGADGEVGLTGAMGGVGVASAGSGGVGGSVSQAPGAGTAAGANATGGGGGGSVGFLQTYTPDPITPTLTPSMASPALQPNLHVKTR